MVSLHCFSPHMTCGGEIGDICYIKCRHFSVTIVIFVHSTFTRRKHLRLGASRKQPPCANISRFLPTILRELWLDRQMVHEVANGSWLVVVWQVDSETSWLNWKKQPWMVNDLLLMMMMMMMMMPPPPPPADARRRRRRRRRRRWRRRRRRGGGGGGEGWWWWWWWWYADQVHAFRTNHGWPSAASNE